MSLEIKVGAPFRIRGNDYICLRIDKHEETYIANVDSSTVRHLHATSPSRKHGSHIVLKFECEDFEIDDIITESVETIRFTQIDNANPLTITKYHTYKKETDNVSESGTEETSGREAAAAQPQAS